MSNPAYLFLNDENGSPKAKTQIINAPVESIIWVTAGGFFGSEVCLNIQTAVKIVKIETVVPFDIHDFRGFPYHFIALKGSIEKSIESWSVQEIGHGAPCRKLNG